MKMRAAAARETARPAAALLPFVPAANLVRRKCACGGAAGVSGECAECGKNRLSRRRTETDRRDPQRVPSVVHDVLRAPGRPLDAATRGFMESRFGHDFSRVRVHTDARAAASAAEVDAEAYTVGNDVVFAADRYAPNTAGGRLLMAHELAHVAQQSRSGAGSSAPPQHVGSADDGAEREADAAAAAAMAGGPVGLQTSDAAVIRRKTPRIKKVTVHLTPPQTADLEWQGTAPATASGSDHFTVSTGKGYGDPGDPPGTCKRDCCSDAATQCDAPHDQPGKVGSCCTYTGSKYWTGTPQAEHNGWAFWTPIQPYYSARGIALHAHYEVSGKPIGHGCVRMDEENAQRIADFSDGGNTNVTIDGKASPVACKADRQCGAKAGTGGGASLEAEGTGDAMAENMPVVPGLEGEMT